MGCTPKPDSEIGPVDVGHTPKPENNSLSISEQGGGNETQRAKSQQLEMTFAQSLELLGGKPSLVGGESCFQQPVSTTS